MSDEPKLLPPPTAGNRGLPGQPGNKAGGKPKGAKNHVTRMVEVLVAGEAEQLVRSVIELAKQGNHAAINAVMGILAPPRKGRAVEIDMGPLDGTAESLATATTAILRAAADGLISADEGQQYGLLLAAAARSYEVEALEARIAVLEGRSQ
jgi:hypothetical protein